MGKSYGKKIGKSVTMEIISFDFSHRNVRKKTLYGKSRGKMSACLLIFPINLKKNRILWEKHINFDFSFYTLQNYSTNKGVSFYKNQEEGGMLVLWQHV